MTREFDSTSKILMLNGTANLLGDYQIMLTMSPYSGDNIVDTLVIHSVDATGIESIENNQQGKLPAQIYDLQGRQRTEMQPGEIYIIRREGKAIKVMK